MARTPAGADLTDGHRGRQLRVRSAALADLLALWPSWSVESPGSFDSFASAVAAVTRDGAARSAAEAGAYYEAFRLAEQADGPPTLRLADPPDRDYIATNLRATGLTGTVRALRAGRTMGEARQVGFVQMAGAVSRMTLAAGNRTVLGSVAADPQTRGWRRITSGDPCSFCAMLAGRGGVYGKDTVGFQAHNHCACTSEPAYQGSAPPAANDEFSALWDESTAGVRGGAEQRRVFRRVYEGRA